MVYNLSKNICFIVISSNGNDGEHTVYNIQCSWLCIWFKIGWVFINVYCVECTQDCLSCVFVVLLLCSWGSIIIVR